MRGLPYDELYNVAWEALAKAVERYDPDKYQKTGLPLMPTTG